MSAPESLSPDQFHSFDVEVSTHDLLRKGVTAASLPNDSGLTHHRVNISSEYSHAEAQHIAALMRIGTAGYWTGNHSVMPTATHTRI